MESYTLKYLIRRCKFEEESENKLKRVENILSNLLLHSLELSSFKTNQSVYILTGQVVGDISWQLSNKHKTKHLPRTMPIYFCNQNFYF